MREFLKSKTPRLSTSSRIGRIISSFLGAELDPTSGHNANSADAIMYES
jgi:hypothetical protein